MFVIEEDKIVELPKSLNMIATVMQVLEQSNNGRLDKSEVTSAIQKAA